MSNSKDAVRKILDLVKADKRTSLTAPEGKLVCDAYGIPVPKEGVAKSVNGNKVHVRADCICVHSDTPNAVEVAQAVKAAVAEYLG